MKVPELPSNENARLKALRALGILDSEDEVLLDDLASLAAHICGTPSATISFIDTDRQWFKARRNVAFCETGRDVSFCGHAIHQAEVFEVPNALKDDRFFDNPLVTGEPHIRFYAGATLVSSDGYNLGTICVFDNQPRKLSESQRTALLQLAKQVVSHLDLRFINDRQAQRAAFHKAILGTASSAIVVISPEGLITECNPVSQTLLGFSVEELIGSRFADFRENRDTADSAPSSSLSLQIGLEVADDFDSLVARMPDGKPQFVQWIVRCRDGSSKPVLLSLGGMVDKKGSSLGYVAVLTDITLLKETERALHFARERAAEAARIKSEFLANMSHEIRTPMNGVLGMLGVLMETPMSQDQTDIVEVIQESAESLLNIIDNILDFSKLEAGKLILEKLPFCPASLIESVCLMLNPVAGTASVELLCCIDPECPRALIGDEGRLRQVVVNLIGNAVKFSTGVGRTGRVHVALDYVSPSQTPACLRITVRDNGVGMDDDNLEKIFSPFDQADTSTHRKFGGTGLGLSISKELVVLMGGTIKARSTLGEGSTFEMEIPAAVPTGDLGPREMPVDLAGLSCMLLGDDPDIYTTVTAQLKQANGEVERFSNTATLRKSLRECKSGQAVIIVIGHSSLAEVADELISIPDEYGVGVLVLNTDRRNPTNTVSKDGPVFSIDVNALRQRDLVRAAAAAAGQIAFEKGSVNAGSGNVAETVEESGESAGRASRVRAQAFGKDGVEQGDKKPDQPPEHFSTILLAEDNTTNQKVIVRQLRLMDLKADVCADGEHALERLNQHRYSLLITDLHMPHMDGYELAAAVRSGRALNSDIPIVAFSADIQPSVADRCREAGINDFLRKPAKLEELKAVIEKWQLPPESTNRRADSESKSTDNAEDAENTGVPYGSAATLDLNVLKTLVGDDPETISEILQEFKESATIALEELQKNVELKASSEVADTAHMLKSSARAVGALGVGDIAEALEAAGKKDNAAAMEQLFADLDSAMAEALSELGLDGGLDY